LQKLLPAAAKVHRQFFPYKLILFVQLAEFILSAIGGKFNKNIGPPQKFLVLVVLKFEKPGGNTLKTALKPFIVGSAEAVGCKKNFLKFGVILIETSIGDLNQKAKVLMFNIVLLHAEGATAQRLPGLPLLKTFQAVNQNIPAQNSHGKTVSVRFKVTGMIGAETAGLSVQGAKTAVAYMLEKHDVNITLRTVGNDTAKRASRQGGSFFQFKKIDVLFNSH
jgi:hypothetical protein